MFSLFPRLSQEFFNVLVLCNIFSNDFWPCLGSLTVFGSHWSCKLEIAPMCYIPSQRICICRPFRCHSREEKFALVSLWPHSSVTSFCCTGSGQGADCDRCRIKGPLIGGPFTLMDMEGRLVTQHNLSGNWVLLYFGYTSSPDIGPAEVQKMAKTIDILGWTAFLISWFCIELFSPFVCLLMSSVFVGARIKTECKGLTSICHCWSSAWYTFTTTCLS